MNKTLRISFSLKNTYRVNGVLFSLKQIPLLKRLLPATLYQIRGAENLCKHFVCTVGSHFCISRQVPLLYHDGMWYRYPL